MSDIGSGAQGDFAGKFAEEWEKTRKETKKVSILVMGGSGVGKSSLVNLVFKKDIAQAGAGRPVTKGINLYENDYLSVYDSEGYESGEERQRHYNQLIEDFLAEKARALETDVHLIWYCVSAPSARFTDLDATFIKQVGQDHKKPLAVVLTKVDIGTEEQIKALSQAIKEGAPDIPIFASSTDESLDLENGLSALDDWSREHLEESLRLSFISVSNRNLDAKERKGLSIVKQHIVVAFGTGFLPIPFSDAPALISNQVGLLARLCSLWDMASLKQAITGSSAVGMVMSTIGKTLAGNLLKLIPGPGTLAGGLINGSVAGGLTYALGAAVNKLCRKISEDHLAGKSIPFPDYLNEGFLNTIRDLYEQYMASKNENAGEPSK